MTGMNHYMFMDARIGERHVEADFMEFSGDWVCFWNRDPRNAQLRVENVLVLAEPAHRVSHVRQVAEQ